MVRSDVSMLRRIMQPLQSMFGLTSPTQVNDGANQIDHETGAFILFFPNNVKGSSTPPSNFYVRMKETRPTPSRHRDHLN